MRFWLLLSTLGFVVGCTTPEVRKDHRARDARGSQIEVVPPAIPLDELQSILRLELPDDNLGFVQERFKPCEIGAGGSADCHREYLGMVGFRIQCRDSTGTVESIGRLSYLPNPNVRWEVAWRRGRVRLDEEGYGVIRVRSKWSIKRSKLKIFSRGRFLYMSIEDVGRIVVPRPWCQ